MRVVFTVEDVRGCHFRVDADYPDSRGRIEKVWDPVCPYCGSRLFTRWWKHEMPDPEPQPKKKKKERLSRRPAAASLRT